MQTYKSFSQGKANRCYVVAGAVDGIKREVVTTGYVRDSRVEVYLECEFQGEHGPRRDFIAEGRLRAPSAN